MQELIPIISNKVNKIFKKTEEIKTDVANIVIPKQKVLSRQPPLVMYDAVGQATIRTYFNIVGAGQIETLYYSSMDETKALKMTIDGVVMNISPATASQQKVQAGQSGILDFIASSQELLWFTKPLAPDPATAHLIEFMLPKPIYFSKSFKLEGYTKGLVSLRTLANYSLYKDI